MIDNFRLQKNIHGIKEKRKVGQAWANVGVTGSRFGDREDKQGSDSASTRTFRQHRLQTELNGV